MNIPLIFFSFLGLWAAVWAFMLVNMMGMMKDPEKMLTGGFNRHIFGMIGHVVCALGTIGFGIAWIVQALTN